MKMLDYHLHFAQLANEDQLRDADRRRSQARPRERGARFCGLRFRPESREAYRSAISPESSGDPSSTTTTSRSRQLWASRLSRHAGR